MSVIGTQTETLLTGLSSFWQTMFADRDQLNALYSGTETLLGQAYLDLLTQVLNANLAEVPVFNKEYWHLQLLREDRLSFDASEPAPYIYDVREPLVGFEMMLNRIYNPTVAWERGIDFEVRPSQICFYENPFEADLSGIAARRVDITPTVYKSGIDATLVAPSTVEFRGILHRGTQGETFGTEVFRDLSGAFTEADVGRQIEIIAGAGPEVRTIVQLKGPATIALDVPLPAPLETGVRWRVLAAELFTTLAVGDQLVLEDPTQIGVTHTHTIDTILSPLSVTVTQAVDLPISTTQSLAWSHRSQDNVAELSFWLPDAMFDRENLYLSFGYLINRHEPSSESYRSLIQGIFQYFMLGPALQRAESALNLMVGVPVVRQDGEVVTAITPTQVITDYNTYTIPAGSVRGDIDVGSVLNAFETLTQIFTVTDYVEDPFWHYGKIIPRDLTEGLSFDRNVDANLRDAIVGRGNWVIGDPRSYVGADFNGQLLPQLAGQWLAFEVYTATDPNPPYGPIPVASPIVTMMGQKLPPNALGKTLLLEGVPFDIVDVDLIFEEDALVELNMSGAEATAFWEANALLPEGEVVVTGQPLIRYPGATFDVVTSVGCLLSVNPDTPTGIAGLWKIEQVVSADTVRIVPHELYNAPPNFVQGTLVQSTRTLNWELVPRAPLRHNLGYNLMQDYLRTHICYVSYDLNKYAIPYPRARADIQDVLLEGKPSHVYLMLSPAHAIDDMVYVGQESFGIRHVITEEFLEVDPALSVGGDWTVGDYYQYTGPNVAWTHVTRPVPGTPTTVPAIQDAQDLHLRLTSGGPPNSATRVVVLADYGYGFQPLLDDFLHDGETRIRPTDNAINFKVTIHAPTYWPETYAVIGFTTTTPGVHIDTAHTLTSSAGIGSGDGFFEDPSFYFTSFDAGRELIVETPTGGITCRVAMVIDEHTVSLYDAITGLEAEVPVGSGYNWWLGAPRQFATPLTIGGSNHRVDRGTLIGWPLSVTFTETGNIGAPGPLLNGPPGPII